ncbi:hypothetical protein Mapa_000311 [Marchantia paleacea]|nr:hypothetical protein Mapa_000311 [Marchantia paleacea]
MLSSFPENESGKYCAVVCEPVACACALSVGGIYAVSHSLTVFLPYGSTKRNTRSTGALQYSASSLELSRCCQRHSHTSSLGLFIIVAPVPRVNCQIAIYGRFVELHLFP